MSETGHDIAEHKGPRPPAKNPRISRRMRQAIELYISGAARTQKEAAEKAGISPEHLCRTMQKDHARAFVARRSAEMFSDLLPKAVRALDMVLDGDNKSAAVAAALAVLRQHGLVNPDAPAVSLTLNTPGYVIDLSSAPASGAPIIDGEIMRPRLGELEADDDGAEGDA